MPYIEVPVIGSGVMGSDPYRARINTARSAIIPTGADGKPLYTTCIVWVPTKYENDIPRTATRITVQQARDLISQLDPRLKPQRLETRANLHRTRNR